LVNPLTVSMALSSAGFARAILPGG
jgi:hypothetical protein